MMKKNSSKSDFKNLKIKRDTSSSSVSSLNSNNSGQKSNMYQTLSPRTNTSQQSSFTKSNNNNSYSQPKVLVNEFKRDLNFYMRQSSKPWAEIL